MFNKNDFKKIREIIEEFFKKMTFEVEIDSFSQSESISLSDREREKIYTISINLKTSEPKILIGEKGQTLAEIQRLLNIILKKQIKEPFFIEVDVESYKKKKIDYLKETARTIADEVSLTKKEKWLPPMTAQERRIIHLELAERKDVTTESIGEEPERQVVIKPSPQNFRL